MAESSERNVRIGYGWAATRQTAAKTVRAAVLLFVAVAAMSGLHRMYEEKFQGLTGDAEWIWIDRSALARRPVAFFAIREFEVDSAGTRLRLKIAADPSYEVWFNGRRIAGRRAASPVTLDVYDLDALARVGTNRLVVGLRSDTGVGGLLAGVDFGPTRQNEIVSNAAWSIVDRWSPMLATVTTRGTDVESPVELGRAPSGRWDFPEAIERPLALAPETIVRSSARFSRIARVPGVRIIAGVAILRATSVPATIFDFGGVHGRGVVAGRGRDTRVVQVRYLSNLDELELPTTPEALVIARGETEVVDPVERDFRYLAVLDTDAVAWVLTPELVRR